MQIEPFHQFQTGFSNGIPGLFAAMDEIGQACRQNGVDERSTNLVRLCIEELVTNALKYGAHDGMPVTVSIVLVFEAEDRLRLIIEDDSLPFNPLTEAPPPDLTDKLEDRMIGGMGIYLVKNMTRAMEYQYKDRKNILTIII